MDQNLLNDLKGLPQTPGVYLFADKENQILYVGKALNLQHRVRSYKNVLDPKTKLLFSQVAKINHIKVFSEFEALLLESSLIKKYQPKYNLRLKDDKSFLYIAVTPEEYPKVLSVRKNDLTQTKYLFGPFPSAKTVKEVLFFLRKIFPYCSQKGKNLKPCFWHHLKLCDPCPGEINKLIGEEKKKQKQIYLRNLKNLAAVLSGESKNLIKNLTSQMQLAAKQQNFEQALTLRDQREKLNWLTGSYYRTGLYLEKPNFFEEEQQNELKTLKKLLKLPSLKKIEGYDLSNLSGLFASGSMVVFADGIMAPDQYRRFKIKRIGQPNDVGMLTEVLTRRLKHQEWTYPDLIMVDGGQTQVSAALKIINLANLDIPVIGLAKKMERIIYKDGLLWRKLKLDETDAGLNLLKRIRDESHRFALAYHFKLREKTLGLT
ncbi:MAG: GIY-YIG nuclease family protein [Patescibacteria group bacterium]|nr:GIY-YIG nuclease family protein [Patescibacteria group bacterium]